MSNALLMIDNRDLVADDGATFDVLNPMDGSVATHAAAAGVAVGGTGGNFCWKQELFSSP